MATIYDLDTMQAEVERLRKENETMRCCASLWKRKAKELYRVVSAFDEEHASIVTSNMRLARENGIMRDALEILARKENHRYLPSIPTHIWTNTMAVPPWEYAQSKLDELEKIE